MKSFGLHKFFLAFTAIIGLALSTFTVAAQNSPDTAAPQLAYGVPEILKLSQAEVGDDTITAYIRNTGTSYGLDADQIIYLKQQGISDHVLTAMLNQPKAAPAPAPLAAQSAYPYAAQTPVAYAPQPYYDQGAQPSTVYVPNSQTYYYSYAQPYFYPTFFIPFQTFHGCCFAHPCSFSSSGHFHSNGSFHGAVAFHGNGGGFHGAVAFSNGGGFHSAVAFHGGGGGGMMMHR